MGRCPPTSRRRLLFQAIKGRTPRAVPPPACPMDQMGRQTYAWPWYHSPSHSPSKIAHAYPVGTTNATRPHAPVPVPSRMLVAVADRHCRPAHPRSVLGWYQLVLAIQGCRPTSTGMCLVYQGIGVGGRGTKVFMPANALCALQVRRGCYRVRVLGCIVNYADIFTVFFLCLVSCAPAACSKWACA